MTITLSRSRFINSIVALCGDKDLSKHWLISWTNVDFSLMGSSESNSIGPESLFSSDFEIILTRATLNAEISPAAQISIGHQIVNTMEVGAPDPPQIEVTPAPTSLTAQWVISSLPRQTGIEFEYVLKTPIHQPVSHGIVRSRDMSELRYLVLKWSYRFEIRRIIWKL